LLQLYLQQTLQPFSLLLSLCYLLPFCGVQSAFRVVFADLVCDEIRNRNTPVYLFCCGIANTNRSFKPFIVAFFTYVSHQIYLNCLLFFGMILLYFAAFCSPIQFWLLLPLGLFPHTDWQI